MDATIFLEQTGKVVLAAFLGGLIGWEREVHGQAAGFRTNILVSLGACLMMMLSLHMEQVFRNLDAMSVVRLDPGRIASYAIASMGFLGAGAIIKGKGTVRGLTTAAGLWMVTGIGLAVGAGFYVPAVLTCFASMAVLYLVRKALRGVVRHDAFFTLTITCSCGTADLEGIKGVLTAWGINPTRINYLRDQEMGETTYRLQLRSKDDLDWEAITEEMNGLPGLKRISWEDAPVP